MNHRQVAEHIAKTLLSAEGAAVEQVILFGSVARGEEREHSDVDLLVVARDRQRVRAALRKVRGELLAAGAPRAQVLLLSPEQLGRLRARNTVFYRRLQREGAALLVRGT